MKFGFSRRARREAPREYFCEEPWTGMFSVETNHDVTFCPCYLQMKIGNLNESSMHEIWNADELVEMRASFTQGKLPAPCQGQTCPVVTGGGTSPT
ncbi:MAG: Iron-sulfur cluster-binding domain [Thermoleophilaceae bacterium]|jgi:MoaA/NifB/PqqE/SkfB family radical SAM enzyme|nr:Iron-sulfur cluster-binding domain [Thermoleophilaceae bacterium]